MKLLSSLVLLLVLPACLGMLLWSFFLKEQQVQHLKHQLASLEAKTDHLAYLLQNRTPSSPTVAASTGFLIQDPYETVLRSQLGAHFKPTKTLREPFLTKPEHLHPFNPYHDVATVYNWCVPSLAKLHVGKYEQWAPELAKNIEMRRDTDSYVFAVTLYNDLFWNALNPDHFENLPLDSWFQQKHRVTAHDFKFYFDAIMNPYVADPKACALRQYYHDIQKIVILDDTHFEVHWKIELFDGEPKCRYNAKQLTCGLTPLPCFVFQYLPDGSKILEEEESESYRNNSLWAQNFSQHWAKNELVSCGPYNFVSIDEQKIRLRKNPYYPHPLAALHQEIHFIFKPSPESVWQDFKAGNLDLCYLSPNQIKDFEKFVQTSFYEKQLQTLGSIEKVDFIDKAYFYIGWNLKNPLFEDIKVRQALNHAINKQRIIEQNLNQMALNITGPFFCHSTSYDQKLQDYDYNPQKTKKILYDLGWSDQDQDGILEKTIDGVKRLFSFRLNYFSKSLHAKMLCQYLAQAFKEVGIECILEGLDVADLSRAFEDKSFDAIFKGWALGTPPEDPRQLWHSSGSSQKGSSNAIGFSHLEADKIIETLQYEDNPTERTSLYHAFHTLIHEQSPYTFLYSPKKILCYRSCLKNIMIPKEHPEYFADSESGEPDFRIVYFTSDHAALPN